MGSPAPVLIVELPGTVHSEGDFVEVLFLFHPAEPLVQLGAENHRRNKED